MFCVVRDYSNSKQKAKYYKQTYKTRIKIAVHPGLAKSRFEQPGPGAPPLGLAESIDGFIF